MFEGLLHIFSRRPLGQAAMDILDLAVVTLLIYRSLLVLKGTRAVQMGAGIGIIFLIYIAAKWFGLVTLQHLFSVLLSSFILIVVVVFQNDIRRALMRMGANALLGGFGQALEERVVDEVVAATTDLARHRIGALIAFEQDANLEEFVVGQGIQLDANVTRELLVTMFVPESVNKLHDGALIIRNLRVAKAGVFFPMPEAKNVDVSFGSRHRAAIGITEETDAVVVVVSEERGTISFCFNGNIVSNIDAAELRKTLLRVFRQVPKKSRQLHWPWHGNKQTAGPVSGRVAIATPPTPRVSTLPKAPAVPKIIATPAPGSIPPPPASTPAPTLVASALETPRPKRELSTPMEPATSTPQANAKDESP